MPLLVIPQYDPSVNWKEQYFAFMDENRLWKGNTFDGKTLSGKDYANKLIDLWGDPSMGSYAKGNRASLWCYQQLRAEIWAVNNRLALKRTWLPEGESFAHKAMLTLNLPKDKTMLDAYNLATQFIENTSWIERAEYSIEYHGKEEGHPHAHIVIFTNNGRYRNVGNIKNALINSQNNTIRNKTLSKVIKAANFITITVYNSNSSKYVEGEKQLAKTEAVAKDKVMREQFGLADSYIIDKTK